MKTHGTNGNRLESKGLSLSVSSTILLLILVGTMLSVPEKAFGYKIDEICGSREEVINVLVDRCVWDWDDIPRLVFSCWDLKLVSPCYATWCDDDDWGALIHHSVIVENENGEVIADPVVISTGEYVKDRIDIMADAPGNFVYILRHYGNQHTDNNGLGNGWDSSLFVRLSTDGSGNVDVEIGDGEVIEFTNEGAYFSSPSPQLTLVKNGSDHILTTQDGDKYYFDSTNIQSRVNIYSKALYWDYDGTRVTGLRSDPGAGLTKLLQVDWDTNLEVITKISDVRPNVSKSIVYEYDSDENGVYLTKVSGACASCASIPDESYTYHSGGSNIDEVKDAYGNSQMKLYYDNDDRVVTQIRAYDANYACTATISRSSGLISVTDFDGATEDYYVNPNFYVTKHVLRTSLRPNEGDYESLQEWSATNRKTRLTLPGGRIVTANYGSDAQISNYILYKSGGSITRSRYEYAPFEGFGRVTKYMDSEANELQWSFDSTGRGTRYIYSPSGAGNAVTRTYAYNDTNNIITRTDEAGIKQLFFHDSREYRVSKITDSDGLQITEQYEVNAYGKITKRIDPNNNNYEIYYSSTDKITKRVSPDGTVAESYYDANGRLTRNARYNSAGSLTRTTDHFRDGLGRITKTTAPGGFDTEYLYDGNDRVTWRKDPDGTEKKTIYDERDLVYQRLVYENSNWRTKAEFYYDGEMRLTKKTDRDQYVVSSEPAYDDYGRMTRRESPVGNYSIYYYDSEGRVTREVAYDSGDTSLATKDTAYDESGRATRVTDPLNNYVVYQYDLQGRVTRKTNYDSGNTAVSEQHNHYDSVGRVTRTRQLANPGGSTSVTADGLVDTLYDKLGQVTKRTSYLSGDETSSPTTSIATYVYDSGGRIITQTSSDSPTVAMQYDGLGQLTKSITDPTGLAIATSYEYDTTGRQTKVTNPDSTYAVTYYDSGGRVTLKASYDSGGTAVAASVPLYDLVLGMATKTYQISDPANRLTYIDGTDPETEYIYTAAGRLTKSIDPNDNGITHDYDSYGRQITGTDAASNKSITIYDDAGRMATSKRLDYDGSNHITFAVAYEFDALSRVTKTIRQGPDGDITATADNLETIVWFDALGRRTLVQDPKGTQVSSIYDALGRVTRKTEDSAGIARYTDYNYDRASRLTRQTGYTSDATGAQNTDYAYNKAGVMTRVTYPDDTGGDRGYVDFKYDSALRLITRNDQENQDTISVYDSMSRPTSVTRGSEIDTFTYSALGQITLAQRGISGDLDDVSQVERYYDGLGRLTREAQAVKETTALNVDYIYDKVGSVTALYYPGGALTISRTMTAANLTDVISRNGTQIADYDYVGSRVESLIYETGANDVTATRSYDGAARLTRLMWDQVNNTLPDFSYTFDAAFNILTKTHEHRSSNKDEAYTIDGLYRLTDARYDFRTVTHGFTYDDLGNQLTFTEDGSAAAGLYNDANELTSYGGTQAYWDKNGNLTKDAAGGNGPYSYYYDMRNQLTKVTKSGGDVAEYAYDALGRRVQFIDSVNTVTKRFYHNGARVIEEYDAAGTPARQRYYVWGNYIDELLMFNDEAGDDSDYNVCHDQLYSAHGLLSKADGSIAERYDYDAYGLPVIYTGNGGDGDWWDGDEVTATTSAKGLPYLFTGREFEAYGNSLKLQYSRARYYNFALRRWLQRDPIGYFDGMSLYEYCNSHPTDRVDFLGFASADWRFGAKKLPLPVKLVAKIKKSNDTHGKFDLLLLDVHFYAFALLVKTVGWRAGYDHFGRKGFTQTQKGLKRFKDNHPGWDVFDAQLMFETDQLSKELRKRLENDAREFIEDNYPEIVGSYGGYVSLKDYARDVTEERTDWGYYIHRYDYWAYASEVNCELVGEDLNTSRAKFSYKFRIVVKDNYDWDSKDIYNEENIDIESIKGYVFTALMQLMHNVGLMREYPLGGNFTLKKSWMKGERAP